jgi:hypothetical protein
LACGPGAARAAIRAESSSVERAASAHRLLDRMPCRLASGALCPVQPSTVHILLSISV